MSNSKINKRKYVKLVWWRYLFAAITLLASVAFDMWFPLITMSIVDDVIIAGNIDLLWPNLIKICICSGGRAIAQFVKEYFCDMAGCNISEELRKDVLAHIQTLSKRFFDTNNTGELMARVKDDIGKVWDLTGFCGMLTIEAVIYFFAVLICMFVLNWKLAIIPLIFLPILGFVVLRLEKKLDKIYGDISEENATLTTVIEENISGVRTVKSFAREKFEIDKFDEHNGKYNELNIAQADYMAKVEPLISIIPKAMQICVFLIGGYFTIQGNLSYGVLVAFLQYASNIVWPIENMGWLINVLASSFASIKKIKKILAEEPDIKEKENAVSVKGLPGELAFSHVSFGLDDREILKDVSFTLPKGKTLGIMGATGTGKSTIVNLIERFYDVTDGSVIIDGNDIRDVKIEDVRGFSSVVTQDVFLFSDTIKENVKLGRKGILGDNEVRRALKKSHAEEFVNKITGGIEAVIGERGIGLSGGQKQRLSIARALAKKSQVLILDDSTSALDMETELSIQKELREKKDMSKIIIAHRISSVKDADEIIVLAGGTIAERGTHDELLLKKGLYYSTYEAQYGNYKEAMKVLGDDIICQ